jgi:hypothetical protein
MFLAIGLISTVVTVRLVAAASESPLDRESLLAALAVFITCGAFYYWQGFDLQATYHVLGASKYPRTLTYVVLGVAALAALATLGAWRSFAAAFSLALVGTSATFNPLSVGFPDWRKTELARAVREVVRSTPAGERPPLWLTYGGPTYPSNGVIGQIMGARTLAGVYGYPQLEFWEPLDPKRASQSIYNRFAIVHLMPEPPSYRGARFTLAAYLVFRLFVSPLHPGLREMGARYVLTFGKPRHIREPRFEKLHGAADDSFAIWKIPERDRRAER